MLAGGETIHGVLRAKQWHAKLKSSLFPTLVSLSLTESRSCSWLTLLKTARTSACHRNSTHCCSVVVNRSWLLVDPVMLGRLPALKLLRLEPQSDLLLGALDSIRAVADVATDINGVVTANGTRVGGKRVGGTEDGCMLDQLLNSIIDAV